MKFAVIVSKFNAEVTNGLREGALQYLKEQAIFVAGEDVFPAPGAFEMPLMAKKLAKSGRYAGVICLGCVIKGDTAHFEFISLGATTGIMQAMLETEVPISFGILTTYNQEQADLRSRSDSYNKGREAAAACLEAAQFIAKLK